MWLFQCNPGPHAWFLHSYITRERWVNHHRRAPTTPQVLLLCFFGLSQPFNKSTTGGFSSNTSTPLISIFIDNSTQRTWIEFSFNSKSCNLRVLKFILQGLFPHHGLLGWKNSTKWFMCVVRNTTIAWCAPTIPSTDKSVFLLRNNRFFSPLHSRDADWSPFNYPPQVRVSLVFVPLLPYFDGWTNHSCVPFSENLYYVCFFPSSPVPINFS